MTIVIFDDMRKMYPELHVTVMADDVCLEMEGADEESLLTGFVTAVRGVAHALDEYRLPLATDKCFTLASSMRLARVAASALGDGSQCDSSVRRLGVDHSLGSGLKTKKVRRAKLVTTWTS